MVMNIDDTTVASLRRDLSAKNEASHYLDQLLRSLDTLIFLEIGIAYYLDNLTLLLLLRASTQIIHVQSK